MKSYPLAIYTARHGLGWEYPREEIPFDEIDACRKAFSPLPDFDAGAKGFDGVWAKGGKIFIARCQSVAAWDFCGRSATYLAVTWISRSDALSIDYERVLAAPALAVPSRHPPSFFEADADVTTECDPSAPETVLPDGFVRAGAIIAGVAEAATVLMRRVEGVRQVTCIVSSGAANDPKIPELYPLAVPLQPDPPRRSSNQKPIVMALVIVWILTFVMAVSFGFLWISERNENGKLRTEIHEMQESANTILRWFFMGFPWRMPTTVLGR